MKKADRDLFLLGLREGDLVQLHSKVDTAKTGRAKVVVGSNWSSQDDESGVNWMGSGWYFKYIDDGTFGIYIGRVKDSDIRSYWSNFHKVHCDGVICIVHNKFLYPSSWSAG